LVAKRMQPKSTKLSSTLARRASAPNLRNLIVSRWLRNAR
jgi:hypothetical protein